MSSATLADMGTRATMADAKKGRKWVKDADGGADTKGEKPAFKPRDGAARRSTLYDHKKAK